MAPRPERFNEYCCAQTTQDQHLSGKTICDPNDGQVYYNSLSQNGMTRRLQRAENASRLLGPRCSCTCVRTSRGALRPSAMSLPSLLALAVPITIAMTMTSDNRNVTQVVWHARIDAFQNITLVHGATCIDKEEGKSEQDSTDSGQVHQQKLEDKNASAAVECTHALIVEHACKRNRQTQKHQSPNYLVSL